MVDERLINGINILTDGLRETSYKLANANLRVDFLDNGIVNDLNSGNPELIADTISSKLIKDISMLKDDIQPLIKEFSDNYQFFINKLNKKNEYSPNNIIYVDVPSFVKYLMTDDKLIDTNMDLLYTPLDKNVNIVKLSNLLNSSPENAYQEFYLNINPEYRSYAEEILVNYDGNSLLDLVNNYLANTNSKQNINIVNLFSKREEYINDICIVYLLLDHVYNRIEDASDANYIDTYKNMLSAAMYRFYNEYIKQVENDILIINPYVYYIGTNPKILINNAVFNKFLERCTEYEATNLIFASVHNESTRHFTTINQLIENSIVLDKYAKDIYVLLYEKNKLVNYDLAKTKIIELFDIILINANENFYNIVGKTSEELKGKLLNKLTNEINYMSLQSTVDFIVKGVIFDDTDKFNPVVLFVRYLYSQNDNEKEIYTSSLTKLVIDILLSSVNLIKQPM